MTGLKTALGLTMLSSAGITVGQVAPAVAIDFGEKVSKMSGPVLQGVITVSAIWAVIYVLRFASDRLLPILEKATVALERVAEALNRCEDRQKRIRREDLGRRGGAGIV